MFTFKPKKVFEKLNKMDRKQAYTIGAIAVVSIVALLMLVSAATSTNDDSFEGMAARGYDLANMPFATDAAEQYLLAAKYPDMKGNGSTLLYSAAEKEARQEEDSQNAEEEFNAEAGTDEQNSDDDNISVARSDDGGYGGYQGGGSGGGRGGHGKTEVGQLTAAGMASAGGSVLNATGPTGDFRQFKGKEDRGNGVPQQLVIGKNKEAAAFRTASMQAARAKGNQITAQRKSVQQLSVDGQNPTTTGPTINPTGGFQIEDGALPPSHDLKNIDEQVAEAAKKAEEKKKEEEKLSFWEQLGQDLLRQMATSLVDSVMGGIGDTIRGGLTANSASRAARKDYGAKLAGSAYNDLPADMKANISQSDWESASTKKRIKWGSKSADALAAGKSAKAAELSKYTTQIGQTTCPSGQRYNASTRKCE